MALFTSYAPPSVYTQIIFNPQASAAIGTARIPVIIGEGEEFFTFPNVELFRGSSAAQDDQAVNEDISDQVTRFDGVDRPTGGRTFNSTYFPVVDGTGKGIVATKASQMQVVSVDSDGNQMPVTVISLNGATGAFATQEIIPPGSTVKLTYFFKRGDTLITNEDLGYQIPIYARLKVEPSAGNSVTISTSLPGAAGNLVTLQFVIGPPVAGGGTVVAVPVSDAQAVTGAGTNTIVINITKPAVLPATTPGTRTLEDLVNLLPTIPTLDAGYLTVSLLSPITGDKTTPLVAGEAASLVGGSGPSSNIIFKVGMAQQQPFALQNGLDVTTGRNIVDGTNGGVITTNSSNITVEVNGKPVGVDKVDGAHGLITLSKPITVGGFYSDTMPTLTATYYTNTWQNTSDLLPASDIASVTQIGLGPNRNDYAEGTDFVLGVDSQGNGTINWGASVTSAIGNDVAGDVAFTPSEVFSSLVDDQVWLVPVKGVVNGKNTVFTLYDTPVDGSGLSRITDDPTKVQIYVGTDPMTALLSPQKVSRLVGATGTVTLYNPPPSGTVLAPVNVYASYYRSMLGNHQYTFSVVTPDYAGRGTYSIADELGHVLPLVTFKNATVTDAGFALTNVVYPYNFADAWSMPNAADETVTLTFNHDGDTPVSSGVQAKYVQTFGADARTLTFQATTPGVSGNDVTIAIDSTTATGSAVTILGNAITINANHTGTLLTPEQVVALSPFTVTQGQITCVASTIGTLTGSLSTLAAVHLTGGIDPVLVPYAHSYTVSSDAGANGSHGVGYLNQTYQDQTTGFRVTIVNPNDHLSFGATVSGGGSYSFAPGNTISYTVSKTTPRHTGNPGVVPSEANNRIAIPGVNNKVTSTFNSTAKDTVIVSTFNMSGKNPDVGVYYYVSFTTNKTANDYKLRLFTNPSDAYALYGQPTAINRLSLGVSLMALNGVQTFGVIQVPTQPNTNFAASSDYIASLQQLTKHLPGTNRKVDVVVPLSNDPSVHQALSRQLLSQAGPRQKGEGIGFVGYSQFTTPDVARGNSRALKNSRMIAIGTPAAAILITNPTTGQAVEYPIDGPFMAAAMAGLNCNPANDVATTLTLQNMAGFSRLLITYDDPTMDMMAADGLTMLLNNNGALQIRHYKTTDPSNDLTSEPTSITISDYVAQQFRLDLQEFIGRKLIDSLVNDIQVVCNARLKSLVDNVIIGGYQSLSVVVNPSDPTEVDVTVTFKPIFSLLYASVTFIVQTSL